MIPSGNARVDGERCLLPTPPLLDTKRLAALHGCDIAIANDAGIGNVLMYTRVVDDLARSLGRQVHILTAGLKPPVGLVAGEDPFAIWRHNPYIDRIVDADKIDESIMVAVNRERDNLAHFGHMIENIAYQYGLRPSALRPSIYLSENEMRQALRKLEHLPRPLVCLHPYSTSGPGQSSPWYAMRWHEIVGHLRQNASIVETRMYDKEDKGLGLPAFSTTLREMFALVWACDLVICLDSAIAHVATAFQRAAVVLWDPSRKVAHEERCQRGFSLAALSRWSYPQNDNVMILGGGETDIVDIIVATAKQRLRSHVR